MAVLRALKSDSDVAVSGVVCFSGSGGQNRSMSGGGGSGGFPSPTSSSFCSKQSDLLGGSPSSESNDMSSSTHSSFTTETAGERKRNTHKHFVKQIVQFCRLY